MQTQEALVTQVAYATSDQAVEQWAYRNKWVRVGEHPVQLEPSGSITPTPAPAPLTQTEAQPTGVSGGGCSLGKLKKVRTCSRAFLFKYPSENYKRTAFCVVHSKCELLVLFSDMFYAEDLLCDCHNTFLTLFGLMFSAVCLIDQVSQVDRRTRQHRQPNPKP